MRVCLLLTLLFLTVAAPATAHAEDGTEPENSANTTISLDERGEHGTDYIEADSGEYVSGDRLELVGNVLLHTESTFPGATLEVRADRAVWDEKQRLFTVPGATSLSLPEYDLEISGEELAVNLEERNGILKYPNATMPVQPELLADETGLINHQYVRFRSDHPLIHLRGGELVFREDHAGAPLFEFRQISITSTEPESADWLLKVQQLLYAPGRFISLRNVRIQVAGLTVGYVPRLKTKLGKGGSVLAATIPLPGLDEDDGFYLKQALFADAGKVSADVYTRYYTRNDEFWNDVFLYTEPTDNSRIGVHFGRDRNTDRWNKRVGKTTHYDFYYQQKKTLDWPLLQEVEAKVSVAEIGQDMPDISSRSNRGTIKLNTPAYELGSDARLRASFGAQYSDYSWGDSEFLTLHSQVKLAKATPWGIDFLEFAHTDKLGSSPFRFDDDFPENLLKANKNFQLLPHLTGRVSADYDFDLGHFDNLVAGLSKEFKSFYLGGSYNFARGAAGVEVAVKF